MSVNKAILVGHVGKDPEIRYSASNNAVASFSLATNRVRKNQQGEKVEETEWHRIVAFGRVAEICRDYVHKGKQVYIEGRLQTREWEDKSGSRRSTTEIVTEVLKMLGQRGRDDAQIEDVQSNHVPMEGDVPF
jgi:single-strand DNA-binding protein